MMALHSLRLCTDYLSKVLPICRVDIPAHIIPHNSRPMDHPQIYFAMFVWYVDLLAVSLNMHLAFCLDPFLSHTHQISGVVQNKVLYTVQSTVLALSYLTFAPCCNGTIDIAKTETNIRKVWFVATVLWKESQARRQRERERYSARRERKASERQRKRRGTYRIFFHGPYYSIKTLTSEDSPLALLRTEISRWERCFRCE